MYLAPLLLLVLCETLLFWAGRLARLSDGALLAGFAAGTAGAVALAALLRRRESAMLAELRLELSGMRQKVAKSARRYQSLMEGAGNAIFVFDAQSGRVEEVNRMGVELLGFDQQEFSCLLGRDLLHPAEYEKFYAFLDRLKNSASAEIDGLQIRKKNGSLFLGEINATLIDLGDQQLVHCILRDITEKKRIEREIWQRNRELSILNDILTGMNRGPETEGVSEATLVEIMELFQAGGGSMQLLGIGGAPPETSVSRKVSAHLGKLLCSFIARAPEQFREVRVQGGEAGECLLMSAAAEGWRSLTSVPLAARSHLVGVLFLMHPSPRVYTPEELRFLAVVGQQLGSVIEKSRLFAELTWKTAELLRSHRLLEKSSHNLSLSEDKLKRNLALVEQAHLDLSRLDRMKNQFLGMVSHEFNTPLTSIISGSEYLLQQGWSAREGGEVLAMVRDGGLRLKELVADLLKLIKLEAQGGNLDTSAIQLKRFLEALTVQLQPQLDKRKQKLTLTDLESLPFFDGDRSYLERLFGELLLNAIKFSPEGDEIEVTGKVVDKDALWERRETLERFNADFLGSCGDRCFLQVEVRDHGIGIPAEEQQGIFQLFYEVGEIRHHSSGSSKYQGKGAGLGLAIVKGMVEAHGGMVWVECREGSSFFLLLPLEQEASQAALF